jgi:hypothetical protein
VIPTDVIAQSVARTAAGGNVGLLLVCDVKLQQKVKLKNVVMWGIEKVKDFDVVMWGIVMIVRWVGKKVKDCGEDSGAKYPQVLAFAAIATMDRTKSIVVTQEEIFILLQLSQRIQLLQ